MIAPVPTRSSNFLRTGGRRVVVACASLGVVGVLGLAAAPNAAAAPNSQDRTFMMKNAQTNLAEISLAGLVPGRAKQAATKTLADMTLADHRMAMTNLQKVAATAGVTLPTLPNAAQLADAVKVKSSSASSFDLTYDTVQVTGHQLSIADTKTEIAGGSDPATVAYAKEYLPVAQRHLTMASANVQALGGSAPTQVPAGSGGQRAAGGTNDAVVVLELVAGAALVAGGVMVMRSRRRELHGE